MHVRIEEEEDELAMGDVKCSPASATCSGSAMAASYNDQIRPLLDAVDRLRQLKVTQEGIQLPTIVVVGDQSSGKSSVLESLAGISLPRGQGICTRVPLVMRLQDDPADEPVLRLEYGSGRVVTTSEAQVADAINAATAEIAGGGKGISDAPITLVVRKRGVPDLTLVDLPGITRVPVQGQPEDIYDQIAKIIKSYIAPKESLVDGLALHVLLSIRRLVEKHLAEELTGEVLGKEMAGAERMLVPSPGTAAKRQRLRNTISVLRESREVVANIMSSGPTVPAPAVSHAAAPSRRVRRKLDDGTGGSPVE